MDNYGMQLVATCSLKAVAGYRLTEHKCNRDKSIQEKLAITCINMTTTALTRNNYNTWKEFLKYRNVKLLYQFKPMDENVRDNGKDKIATVLIPASVTGQEFSPWRCS
jgi:hypothetical protein